MLGRSAAGEKTKKKDRDSINVKGREKKKIRLSQNEK